MKSSFKLHLLGKTFSRLFWILLTLWVAASLGLLIHSYFRETKAWSAEADYELLQQACSECHNYQLVKQYAKSPGEWRKTVIRMLRSNSDLATEDEKKRIQEMLIRQRSTTGRILFDSRCARCHSVNTIEPYWDLHVDALALLVRQHVRQHNYTIEHWEGEMIVEEITRRKTERPGSSGFTNRHEQILFQQACGVCHSPRFIYRTMCETERSEAELRMMVLRMQQKAPDLIGEEQVPRLTDHSRAICGEGKPAP